MTQTRPRYEVIARALREVVAGSEANARLPSEAELCEQFDVSRMTARQAVGVLVADGLVYRVRGHGTFVAPRRVARLLGSPLSFTEGMRARGLPASSRVLEFRQIDPSPGDRAALRLEPGERPVLLERLRLGGTTPMALERAVVTPRCAGILEADMASESLHAVFERLGHLPMKAHATVSARRATAKEKRLLELGSSGVVLAERRVISDQNDMPLEHTETRYAAERYEFEAVLYRGETEDRT
ncbi:MAG: GntR family transcriptional regulator [Acidimicrobiia bacterium]|nr:GntR family transcriptional regulator [Acidimicrobiia bacterium]